MIANTGADAVPLKIEANGKVIGCQLLDGEHLLEACEQPDAIPANSVLALRIQIEA